MQNNASFRLVDRLVEHVRPGCVVNGVLQSEVLQAMTSIPRHQFVDPALNPRAYKNEALPIGYQQTISQPLVVAVMSAYLYYFAAGRRDKVLEIGMGSGYQSAILSLLWKKVYTIERIEKLYLSAQKKHQELGIKNVYGFYGDGNLGLVQEAPFDSIIITACCVHVPQNLKDQLVVGGCIIAPIKSTDTQQIILYQKLRNADEQITWKEYPIVEVDFVPMLGGTM